MSDTEILARLKKYLALSQSTNPHEAAIALNRAQKLMSEHQLSLHDVQLSAISEETILTTRGLRDQRILGKLLHIITSNFGLSSFGRVQSAAAYSSVTLIGPQDRLSSGVYVLTFLSRQLTIVKKEYQKQHEADMTESAINRFKNKYRYYYSAWELQNDPEVISQLKGFISRYKQKETRFYLEGWLDAVQDKVKVFNLTTQERQLINEFETSHHPDLYLSTQRSRFCTADQLNAFHQGQKDGRQGFELYRGVEGVGASKLTFRS
ncbi:MAG: DUF2786 domain-containing protein [Succinivibrio sp.]|nr:DUF2786 domain-containing protein [Succinivibrio sp.]